MIIVMKKGASKEEIQHVIGLIEELGLTSHPIYGTERTVIAAIGDKREVDVAFLTASPGVERALPILAPYKMASHEVKEERTQIPLGRGTVGGAKVAVIAGPCTVEGRDQLLRIAEAVCDAGAIALRGGAFKPRTNPYTFQGLMEEGLKYLAEARERTGLAVVTEVLSPTHVDLVGQYADCYQIGARNMQNFPLLEAVGRTRKPVLLKRAFSASLEELLLAAEYILNEGNHQVILCERGIRTFEAHTRFTLSLSAVPALHEMSHLPVAIDPSHGTGKSSLVGPMSKAAVAAGADALLVEVHPDPGHAILDGGQSLDIPAFQGLMKELQAVAAAVGRSL